MSLFPHSSSINPIPTPPILSSTSTGDKAQEVDYQSRKVRLLDEDDLALAEMSIPTHESLNRPIQIEQLMSVTDDPSGFMNCVRSTGVAELFYVSRMPPSQRAYWSFIARHPIGIGISLETPHLYMMLNKGGDSYPCGEFLIQLQEKIAISDQLAYRRIDIIHESTGTRREFSHFDLVWPDFALPSKEDFEKLMQLYLSKLESTQYPAVHLHCAGGHGRSGTLLLTRALMAQPKEVVAEELLDRLRAQRMQLVETKEQFEFAVEEAEKLSGIHHESGHFKNPFLFKRGPSKPPNPTDRRDPPKSCKCILL